MPTRKERVLYIAAAQKMHEREPAYLTQDLMETLRMLVFAVLIVIALQVFVFRVVRVDGVSMQPTFFTGERVIAEKLSYDFSQPKRGDVVICYYEDGGDALIKRVIGLAGDTVEVRGGAVFINGLPLDEQLYWQGNISRDTPPTVVPNKHIFVMGDNRNDSKDSRMVGPVPYYRVLGRVVSVIWPISSWGQSAPFGVYQNKAESAGKGPVYVEP